MKRTLTLAIPLVMSLALAACSSSGTASTAAGSGAAATASADGAALMQGELSTVAEDMLGIFKLEDTDLAVDSAQAATLLPLWQTYRSLLNSDTAASVELEAVKTQIDEALTAEQKNAIAAMNLTTQDLFTMAEELGVMDRAASPDGTDSRSDRPFVMSGEGPGGPGGGMPVMPEGGMPSGDTGAMDPSMMMSGTPQAGQAGGRGQSDRFSMALLDPLIELLKERAGG